VLINHRLVKSYYFTSLRLDRRLNELILTLSPTSCSPRQLYITIDLRNALSPLGVKAAGGGGGIDWGGVGGGGGC
jgi:hypothetical protein